MKDANVQRFYFEYIILDVTLIHAVIYNKIRQGGII